MRTYIVTILLLIGLNVLAQDHIIVPFESNWKYLDNGSNQGTVWRLNSYNDDSWPSGPAILGYGEGNENTVIGYGFDPDNKYITSYFRHDFEIDDVSIFKNFLLRLKKDDGALVYVNGQEVMRSNFGANTYDYLDEAYASISSEEEDIIWEELISPSFFQDGANVIAVEVHQYDPESSDLIFDLEITGLDHIPSLYRTPYLQKATTDGITIKWNTDVPTDSKIWYGTSLNDLSNIVESADLNTNHELDITGLEPATNYFYKVGNAQTEFIGGTPDFFFTTNPVIGTAKPTRIWVTGDAGTGKDEQKNVRDSYLNFVGSNGKSDLWLMMGDNAYEHGREADYHMGLFTVYQEVLRNTVSFPTAGNHDLFAEASALTETGTYYDIFALPKNGESGGLPSGKESYYSVDYGNIHIVSLESYDLDRDSTGVMATWLKNDLENTTADWLIAFWHFAPYTKVDHDSDDPDDWDGRAIEMREHINPILEKYGVDVVLSGHSHGYERSFLIDGHYGYSDSLTDDMILDTTSGNKNTTGPYSKPKESTPHKGTVYVVCGNSGKVGEVEADGPHPVMYETNTDFAGSVLIDIVGDTLEGTFLNEQGIIQDYFHIVKENISPTEEAIGSIHFNIFPNPTKEILNVSISSTTGIKDGKLEFYASDGKLYKRVSLTNIPSGGHQLNVNCRDLPGGIYTVKLVDNNKLVKSELLIVE